MGEDVARLKAMDKLPKMDAGAAFPFSALSIATSSEYPTCAQAEPMVAIQTPAAYPASLTVNGVDVHIGSLVSFQQAHDSALSLTVHRGKATTVSGHIVQQGESVIGIFGRGAQSIGKRWIGAAPCPPPTPNSPAVNARKTPSTASPASMAGAKNETFKHPPATQHTVERGDSLYSIAANTKPASPKSSSPTSATNRSSSMPARNW